MPKRAEPYSSGVCCNECYLKNVIPAKKEEEERKMKAILMSIKPRHSKNILNEIKTLEIRKKFPKDYVGWVYIYNTKTTKEGVLKLAYLGNNLEFMLSYDKTSKYQGKVIARFWCDKVEEIKPSNLDNFAKDSCLTTQELENYLWSNICCGYAIHIGKLEIFNKPNELKQFSVYSHTVSGIDINGNKTTYDILKPITKAPQSWCYIEI